MQRTLAQPLREYRDICRINDRQSLDRLRKIVIKPSPPSKFPLASPGDERIYRALDALARAYGPWWLCNDVTRPFWQPGLTHRYGAGPEREDGMVAFRSRGGVAPCPDANLRGTRLRGRGNRVIDPSSLG